MANPKKNRYGMPSDWSTAYTPANATIAAARANALPQGKAFKLAAHGFTFESNRRYSLTVNGQTAHLFYNLNTAGWDVTLPTGETCFYNRFTPAAELRNAIIGRLQAVCYA